MVRIRTSGRTAGLLAALVILVASACEPAEDVRVLELPPLEQSSIESRLGLPLMQGAWPFAGWELAEGDTLGVEAELPTFGTILVMEQKRDSLGGAYQGAGGGAVPLSGEIRRDGVVALAAFADPQDGRYLVGSVAGDTLWLEATTLVSAEAWRPQARAAFVRGAEPAAPFRRIRGVVAAAPLPTADTLLEAADSLPVTAESPAPLPEGSPSTAPVETPATPTSPADTTQPAGIDEPADEPEPEPEPQPEPRPTPAVPEREPPRVIGVPVERDSP